MSRNNSANSLASVENHKSPEDVQEIMSVLRAREQGIANLFLEMCRAAQIPAFKIEGYLKGELDCDLR
jgi:transglutaminase/protease-like cytokinesis protein 3